MKDFNGIKIIGIDHGYGNMKTASTCFPTGLIAYEKEPTFKQNLLIYEGRYYTVGTGHKAFHGNKILDEDYYVLTLAAMARELSTQKLTTATVYLAAGLPLSWVSGQTAAFKDYLLRNKTVDFIFRGADYHIRLAGAAVFPQGFAAVADKLVTLTGVNLLCDIGNGTMNVLKIVDGQPDPRQMFTEKYGTNQCAIAVRENLMRRFHAAVDDSIINQVFRTGTADIAPEYLTVITDTAREYTSGIFRLLRDHEYDPNLMRLHVVGGGGCLVKHFGEYDHDRVPILDDICATARGYEYMAEKVLRRSGGIR